MREREVTFEHFESTCWLISKTFLTLPVLWLTCYGGLLPTANKLSTYLHLSWASLVSTIWQATRRHGTFEPRDGRGNFSEKLSSFFSFQTIDRRKILSSSVFLFLKPLYFLHYQPVPLVKIFTLPVPVIPLSTRVQNKQMGVRGWNAKFPPRSRACRCVNFPTVTSWGPQQQSKYASSE